jgi:hypothetical protein
MSEEKLIRYFIGEREVSWNEYTQTEGSGKFAWKECQHKFIFAIGDNGAIRGCETCGKAWILLRSDVFEWTTAWTEVSN